MTERPLRNENIFNDRDDDALQRSHRHHDNAVVTRQVALLIETSTPYARGILHGIREYLRATSVSWTLLLVENSRGAFDTQALQQWQGDGIIARIDTPVIAGFLARFSVPIIDTSDARLLSHLPCVETDTRQESRLAFEHLAGCGLRHFAFLGHPYYAWSQRREQAFVECARQAGNHCAVYQPSLSPRGQMLWHLESANIADWLTTMPKPVGIMAGDDVCGMQLLEACRAAQLPVPEVIAVIGVDNDDLFCDFSSPPLSSIIPDTHGIGRLAAELLDAMMNGGRIVSGMHLVKPLGLVGRKSTDMLAMEDTEIADALCFIRAHACENIKISDVLETVPMSRRAFESRFFNAVHRSPHEEIMRVRLERIKELLLDTDWALARIAETTGFEHTEYLNALFKKHLGITPGQFRAKHRS